MKGENSVDSCRVVRPIQLISQRFTETRKAFPEVRKKVTVYSLLCGRALWALIERDGHLALIFSVGVAIVVLGCSIHCALANFGRAWRVPADDAREWPSE